VTGTSVPSTSTGQAYDAGFALDFVGLEGSLQSSPWSLFRATGFSFISATVDIVRKPGYNVLRTQEWKEPRGLHLTFEAKARGGSRYLAIAADTWACLLTWRASPLC